MKFKRILAALCFGPICCSTVGISAAQDKTPPDAPVAVYAPVYAPDVSDEVIAATDGASGTVGAIMPPELRALHQSRRAQLAKSGYFEDLDSPPRAEYVLARMEERRAWAATNDRLNDFEALGFEPVEVAERRGFSGMRQVPTLLPKQYREPGSEGFLFSGGPRVKQLYTETSFGTLLIDEAAHSYVDLGTPNIKVGGYPGVIFGIKHKDNQWATVLIAQIGNRAMMIEADQLFDLETKAKFVKMAGQLAAMASSQSSP